jgi:hypothetical protein
MISKIVRFICNFLFLYKKIVKSDIMGTANNRIVNGKNSFWLYSGPGDIPDIPSRFRIIPFSKLIIVPLRNKTASIVVDSR